MTWSCSDRPRLRDRGYRLATRALAVLLFPVARMVAPGHARYVACQWALAARFPHEDLAGLTPAARAAFHGGTHAGAVAEWGADRSDLGIPRRWGAGTTVPRGGLP